MSQTVRLPVAFAMSAVAALAGFSLMALIAPKSQTDWPNQVPHGAAASPAKETEQSSRQELLGRIQRLEAQLSLETRTQRTEVTVNSDQPVEATVDLTLTKDQSNILDFVRSEYASESFARAITDLANAQGPKAIAFGVFSTYVNAEHPLDALRISEKCRQLGTQLEIRSWQINQLSAQFEKLGQPEQTTDLYVGALNLDPADTALAEKLADLDAQAGLAAILESKVYKSGELLDSPRGRENLALFMIKTGGLEGGLDALRSADGSIDNSGWDLYLEHAPERALVELKQATKTDPYGILGVRLASYLNDNDQTEQAVAAIEEVLRVNPVNLQAAQMLAELDAEQGLVVIARNLAAAPKSAELWQLYADQLNSMDRSSEAIEAGLEAFRNSDQSSTPEDELVVAAPNEVLILFEARTRGSNDDEIWGNYADTLWLAGRHDQAIEAWEKARSIDTDDSEWIRKVREAKAGENPLD